MEQSEAALREMARQRKDSRINAIFTRRDISVISRGRVGAPPAATQAAASTTRRGRQGVSRVVHPRTCLGR